MDYRKAGFTQRKPREPGVYLIASGTGIMPRTAPPRLRDGWDVAEVMYWAGSYDNAYRNNERDAFWQITTLGSGVTFAWQPGMWTKGPILPSNVKPNVALTGAVRRPG